MVILSSEQKVFRKRMNHSIALRLKSHWPIKIFLGGAIIIAFWILYFSIQRYPFFTITILEPSIIDQLIPFNQNYVYLYESFWFLMPIAPWLMDSKKDLLSYCSTISLMSLIAFFIFIIWPTACIRPTNVEIEIEMYRTLTSIDRELNACPSLHAAFTVFSALCCWNIFNKLRFHWLCICIVLIWTISILYSTLATQQHLAIDLVAGTFLGVTSYGYFAREKQKHTSHRQ